MRKPKSDYAIQTVTNALLLLEGFEKEEELGVTEIARRLDLHKNNVFRLLATLQERGYIEQSTETERYRLGTRCLEIGQAFVRSRDLVRIARPVLDDLARKFRECTHLGVLHDFDVVHLACGQPDRLLAGHSRVGRRLPAHCTALGKVLLGFGPEALRTAFDRSHVAPRRLESRTPATLVDREKLFEELRAVAGHGFALDLEECEQGLCCVAAPVHDASGRVVAGISVSGPSLRLSEEKLVSELAPETMASAEAISRELGYSRPL